MVTVVVLSGGDTSEEVTWFRIPDLGNLLAIGLGVFALLGLLLVVFVRPTRGSRKPGELRSIRAVVIFTILVALATQFFGPPEDVEEPPAVGVEESASDVEDGAASDPGSAIGGADFAALALTLLVVAVLTVRLWRRPQEDETSAPSGADLPTHADLAPAVEEAHHHLIAESDPRMAVMLAYASLERALAERGHARHPAETPVEHLSRVLGEIPALTAPAVRLGELYELARFSRQEISEEERGVAGRALDRARGALAVAPEDHR